MTALFDLPVLAFDTETTGVNVHEDHIVTACLVRIRPDMHNDVQNWLLNPGIDIPEGATQVHGITTDHARTHGQDPAQALFEMSGRLALWMGAGFPVVAFNAAFDFTILEAENTRYGLPTLAERLAPLPVGPIIDPFVLDKHVDKRRKGSRKLGDTCQVYGVQLNNAHTAEADAEAAAQLARAILISNPQVFKGMSTVGTLHRAQSQWRREQMDSLRGYFDRMKKPHDGCDGGWPLHDALSPVAPTTGAVHEQGALL